MSKTDKIKARKVTEKEKYTKKTLKFKVRKKKYFQF